MPSKRRFWNTPTGLAFLGFAMVALVFLYLEHRAHLYGALPLVLVLACVLMHFMHGGHSHGHHGSHRDHDGHRDEDEEPTSAGGHQHG